MLKCKSIIILNLSIIILTNYVYYIYKHIFIFICTITLGIMDLNFKFTLPKGKLWHNIILYFNDYFYYLINSNKSDFFPTIKTH